MLKNSGLKILLKVFLVLSMLMSYASQAGGNDGCNGRDNCDEGGGDIAIDIDTGGAGASSDSYANSSSTSGSASTSSSGASLDNNVEVNFTSPSRTTVRNVPSPDTPNVYPSSPCRIARSAGLSLAGGALSGGSSIEDEECTLRETARAFQYLGVPEVGLVILCENSAVVNGRKDKKGRVLKTQIKPIGSDRCLRLVREFQGDDADADPEFAAAVERRVEQELSIYREERDNAERQLADRISQLENNPAPRAARAAPPQTQIIQQAYLSDDKKARLAAIRDDEQEPEE